MNPYSVRCWEAHASSLIAQDDRPNASPGNVFWLSNKEEAGQFLWGYRSVWLSQTLLPEKKRDSLVGALFNASRQWTVGVHFNKGLAGAPPEEIEAAKNTSINPVVLDAFALVIIAGQGNPAFKGIVGHEPNLEEAESGAKAINLAMNEILKIVDERGAYLAESDFFEKGWQHSFWGSNYDKLMEVKNKYDPGGLYFMYHGVGSEDWSNDGFTRLK